MGLETLLVGLAARAVGATAFMGFAAIADVSSSVLHEKDDSSVSFSSLLLLTLLFSEISERLLSSLFLSFFFFFFIFSEGLDLSF